MKDFRVTKKDLGPILGHAAGEYPFECCGIITGPDGEEGEIAIHRCANIQNRLHVEDPVEHPRDARTAYYIAPDELLKILKTARENSRSIRAFYHSHTDHKAYFSEEDKRRALFFGEPAYPDAKHIVVSVMGGKVGEIKVFSWDATAGEFKEEPLEE